MSSPSAPTVPETIKSKAKCKSPIATDIEFEPFEDPIEIEETQLLYYRAAPLLPNYTLAAPDYTLDTPHSDEDSEPMESFVTRIASPSGSTSPLSPTPSSSASPASSPILPIQKRYWGTSEPILDTETEGDESEAEGTGSESEESEGEGPGSEGEEAAYEDQQQQAIPVEDTAADEPLGLGYGTARRCVIELAEGLTPSMFEVGKSFRTVPDQQMADEISTPRIIPWLDLMLFDHEPLLIDYMLRRQHKFDDQHHDMPLIYYMEVSGEAKVSESVSDDDAIRLCLLLALEVIFMGRLLTFNVDDTVPVVVKNIEAWDIHFLGAPSIKEHHGLFETYLSKLERACKRGKTGFMVSSIGGITDNSVRKKWLNDLVIMELNFRLFKLEAIIQVLSHERSDRQAKLKFTDEFSV
ncbi:hypothetical protein Tco_1162987 [Tanacetum coccineum]